MESGSVPEHIAIIMDGNGRWAKSRNLPRAMGHKAGVKVLKQTIKDVYSIGVKYLSVYVFSSENWKRPKEEVDFLMTLLDSLIVKEVKELHSHNVKVLFWGNVHALPQSLQEKINWAETFTKDNTRLQLNLLVNYGARQELVQAVNKFIALKSDKPITEEDIASNLYSHHTPDPDLIIRTGGDFRISNFLLWQAAYSEFWVSPLCWPDFNKDLLLTAIADYNKRDRRFGGLNG